MTGQAQRLFWILFIKIYGQNSQRFDFHCSQASQSSTVCSLTPSRSLGQLPVMPGGGGGGVLDISLGGEVRLGPSYPDPV